MGITREDVIYCYKRFLKRNPDSEEVIQYYIHSTDSLAKLYDRFLGSLEYRRMHGGTEQDYLLKCYQPEGTEPFFWCLRADGDDPVSNMVRFDTDLPEVQAVKKVADMACQDEGRTVLDIGANIGIYSITFARDGWKSYAVEAGSRNAGALRITAKMNSLDLEVIPCVVTDRSGKKYFVQNGPWGMVVDENKAGSEELEAFCLDDIENTIGHSIERIDFVKMDCEGSEVATVRGGAKFFKKYNYPPFYCEANRFTLLMQGEWVGSLKDVFAKQGYRAYAMDEDGLLHEVHDMEHQIETISDYYFLHDIAPFQSLISDETIEIASEGYAEKFLDYVRQNNSRWDTISRFSTCMAIWKVEALYNQRDLHAFAEEHRPAFLKDTVLAGIMERLL